jgi:hypothetical protein
MYPNFEEDLPRAVPFDRSGTEQNGALFFTGR